jgi:hypothetical protein
VLFVRHSPQATAQAAQLDRLVHELDNHEECVYASVTTADTIYGSEVVHNLLRTATQAASGGGDKKKNKDKDKETDFLDAGGADGASGQVPQIVLVPYDSRTTAEHGEYSVVRESLRGSRRL